LFNYWAIFMVETGVLETDPPLCQLAVGIKTVKHLSVAPII